MEELRELISIVNGHKTKFLDIISPNGPEKSSQLYKLILTDPDISDTDAHLALYGFEEGRTKYRRLKSRLHNQLINSLFIIDINRSTFNESNIAYYESYRYWAAVKILFQKRAYTTGLKLADKLYRYSIRYEFYELTVAICRDLRRLYAERKNNRKYRKYEEAFRKYHAIHLCEIEAEEVAITLNRIISQKTNVDYSTLSPIMTMKIKQLQDKDVESFYFNRYLYFASIYHEQLNGNYRRIIDICNSAIDFFRSKKFPTDVTLQIVRNRLVIAYINSDRYEEASDTLRELINRSKSGEHNWHVSMTIYFLVKMYKSDYPFAFRIYKNATTPLNLKSKKKMVLEIWQIFNAYLQFIIVRQILIIDEVDKGRFRINKFLNEVPQYSKDKQGLNVAIHIVHILFLLHLRRYDAIIDRMEPLQLYTYRHLKRGATFRSNCFIKMLIQMPKGNFVRKRVERYADKYWQKLQTSQVDVNHQQTTLEIIPYERLWGMVLEMLD